MPRVKGGTVTRRRHKKILKLTKGQYGTRHRLFRRANEAMMKSLWYAYRDRRRRRRDLRRLWITRINAAARLHGLSYSRLINGLHKAEIEVDRKVLADIAVHDPEGFGAIAEAAKAGLEQQQRVLRPGRRRGLLVPGHGSRDLRRQRLDLGGGRRRSRHHRRSDVDLAECRFAGLRDGGIGTGDGPLPGPDGADPLRARTLGVTRGENQHQANAKVEIEPIYKGITQIIGVMMAIDRGVCDEKRLA